MIVIRWKLTDSKVHVAHMVPTWVLSPQVGPMLAPWTLLSVLEVSDTILWSLVAPLVVLMTTFDTTKEDKFGIMLTCHFQSPY